MDVEKLEDLLDMIYAQTNPQLELTKDEILEILELINKEAFRQTEIFKIGWEQITQSKN